MIRYLRKERETMNKCSDCGVVRVPVVHASRPVLAHLYLIYTKLAIVVSIQLWHRNILFMRAAPIIRLAIGHW